MNIICVIYYIIPVMASTEKCRWPNQALWFQSQALPDLIY